MGTKITPEAGPWSAEDHGARLPRNLESDTDELRSRILSVLLVDESRFRILSALLADELKAPELEYFPGYPLI